MKIRLHPLFNEAVGIETIHNVDSRVINECGATGGIQIYSENESTGRRFVSAT
jgi:hypothetical protein